MTEHTLRAGNWEARVADLGAELQSLRCGELELLWEAGPLWPRHAPLLFPVVGALRGDRLRHQGATFSLPRHGFARDMGFAWEATSENSCTLVLEDGPGTRAMYPWPFRLQVHYALSPEGLSMDVALLNSGTAPLPASLGLHPAFRWPLVPGAEKNQHQLVFEREESAPLHRLDALGHLRPIPLPTPIQNRRLHLDETLFREDALVFLTPESRGVRFGVEGSPALELHWEGFPHLGIWSKPDPGPTFLCIEPWQGHASPADWDGEFDEKPGSFSLAAGASRCWRFTVGLTGGPPQARRTI